MRLKARTDANHRAILDTARELGVMVIETHQVGKGCPDAFCYCPTRGWFAVEVKTATGKLTKEQEALHRRVPVCVVKSEAEMLALIGVRG